MKRLLALVVLMALAWGAHGWLRGQDFTDAWDDLVAAIKCGENGTVDWDPDPDYPPPHCG